MRAMAYKLFSSLKGHPLITAFCVVLLFTLPIFPMLTFFWPLIVSTALGVLAVISFGWQSDAHTSIAIAGYDATEGAAGRQDIVPPSPHDERVSNVLMVGNQEVTWLEWLHHEDMQKLCVRNCEPDVWDAHVCDVSLMASNADVDAPTSRVEDKLSVYANDSTSKDEASDGASLCASNSKECDVHPFACCTEGDEGHDSVDEVCVTQEGGNEFKTMQGLALHTQNEGNGYASAGGEELVGMVEAPVSTIDSKNVTIKPISTHEAESGADSPEFLSAKEIISNTSELKITPTHAQGVPSSSKPISSGMDINSVMVEHGDEQNEEERGAKQLNTQDLQWDVRKGDENQSSLRFSFFHSTSFTPPVA